MYQIRADQEAGNLGGARLRIAGRGIGAPNAGPGGATYAGIAYEVTTEDQIRRGSGTRFKEGKPYQDLGRRPKRPGATTAAESLPRGHRRGSPARVSGECACVLSHGCCRPRQRRH